jgi:hypothetical protein
MNKVSSLLLPGIDRLPARLPLYDEMLHERSMAEIQTLGQRDFGHSSRVITQTRPFVGIKFNTLFRRGDRQRKVFQASAPTPM